MNWVWIELHGTMTSPAPGGSGGASINPRNLDQKRAATRPDETMVVPRVRLVTVIGDVVDMGCREA